MKINEIFESIQGEGRFTGYPVLFIRLSGCNRSCPFCDTKYHKGGVNYSITDIIKIINNSEKDIVVWTGGEPLLQFDEIKLVTNETRQLHHLETNGDFDFNYAYFNYIAFSPKTITIAMKIKKLVSDWDKKTYDIKVVTDLKLNKKLLSFATCLMPLTTFDWKKDSQIRQNVWKYCVKHNIKYSPRLQVEIFGKKRGV